MTVSKELAEKVRKWNKLCEKSRKLQDDIISELNELGADGVGIINVFICDNPTGTKQEADGSEYCDQYEYGDSGDSFSGTYYHRIKGTNQFVGYEYWS